MGWILFLCLCLTPLYGRDVILCTLWDNYVFISFWKGSIWQRLRARSDCFFSLYELSTTPHEEYKTNLPPFLTDSFPARFARKFNVAIARWWRRFGLIMYMVYTVVPVVKWSDAFVLIFSGEWASHASISYIPYLKIFNCHSPPPQTTSELTKIGVNYQAGPCFVWCRYCEHWLTWPLRTPL